MYIYVVIQCQFQVQQRLYKIIAFLVVAFVSQTMNEYCDQLYRTFLKQINNSLHNLSRHDMIRAKSWLDKLQVPVTNIIWKQNRNLYLRILLEMEKQGELLKPFNQSPPEGPLPKITLYDVPYPIRIKINEQNKDRKTPSFNKTTSHSRKNSSSKNMREKYLSRRTSLGNNQICNLNSQKIMEHKKKIVFGGLLQSLNDSKQFNIQKYRKSQEQCSLWHQQTINFKERHMDTKQKQHMQTMKTQFLLTSLDNAIPDYKTRKYQKITLSKGEQNYQRNRQIRDLKHKNSKKRTHKNLLFHSETKNDLDIKLNKKQQAKGIKILKKCLKLLASQYEDFSDQIKYKELLQKIVQTGQMYGQNMRDISFQVQPYDKSKQSSKNSAENSSISLPFERYSDRIKQKFTESGQHYKQFMNYLQELN